MTTLERYDPAAAPGDELADACARELEYSALRTATTPARVAECFKAVGIRPFVDTQVAAYKAAKAGEKNDACWRFAYRYWKAAAAVAVAVGLAALAAGNPYVLWGLAAAVVLVAVGCIGGPQSATWQWDSTVLKYYPRPVPTYALELALQLRRELKKAGVDHEFYVDELRQDWMAKGDPFLVLAAYNRLYYLEVWDEPDFGARRTV